MMLGGQEVSHPSQAPGASAWPCSWAHGTRISRSKALAERIVGIEITDWLNDPQIVAKVKEHYGIDR